MENLIKNSIAKSVAILIIVFAGVVPFAHGQEVEESAREDVAKNLACSVHMLKGTFGYSASGTILPTAPLPPGIPPGPYTTLGRVTFDGRGGLTSVATDNFNGFITPFTHFTGVYTVNANCTGGAAINGGVPYRFTITNGGNEILFMVDVPGTLISGSGKKL